MEFRLKGGRKKETVQQALLSTEVFNSKDCADGKKAILQT